MKLSGSSPARRPGMAQSATLWLIALLLGSVSQLALASSEANLVLPNLNDVALASFLGGISGWQLLAYGLLVCVGGLAFGAVVYGQIKAMPVHRSNKSVPEQMNRCINRNVRVKHNVPL